MVIYFTEICLNWCLRFAVDDREVVTREAWPSRPRVNNVIKTIGATQGSFLEVTEWRHTAELP